MAGILEVFIEEGIGTEATVRAPSLLIKVSAPLGWSCPARLLSLLR